ncbi:signal peptidase I [Nocardioides mesophilus]|uniref:Signal peptidase I n=1 Tax=Nocardioides mesophilus TaxID=433659 RepID=A0A7G9RFV5_9ACTN|nr:signal peptidase I [Nocardioides mesophilus]QNN54480.1 signal peptidase I [Nocardioides mesophilus]
MTSATAPQGSPRKRRVPVWLETILLLVLALAVSAVVKTFFVQMFFVPSGSMRPLFVDDDRILVEKWSYWGDDGVERGDVVVFADPGGKWLGPLGNVALNPLQEVFSKIGLYPTGGHLVKRVIGIGGDRVVCCDAKGRVTVNGIPLEEKDYILAGHPPSDRPFDVKVPEGRLWVMGDNRSNSEDSRFHQDLPGGGTIPESSVVGKVWAIVWPFDRFTFIGKPDTFSNPALVTSGTD